MTKTESKRKPKPKTTLPFNRKLVLNQWLLSLFGVKDFEALATYLRDESLEGLDENNIHRFHHVITDHFYNLPQLPANLLLEYDQNIVRHTQRLNERRITRRENPLVWKYFQYLALLFTEIYLDRYFRDPDALLSSLNGFVQTWNADKNPADQIQCFADGQEAWPQLNKLAFWCATGSGKTLLMHCHIQQFRHYADKHNAKRNYNRVILLTPNEGLSLQHLKEFHIAGIEAELFNPNRASLFGGKGVEIIDINKLKDDKGIKTVAVDSFMGNNLVLVDEGHRGAAGGEEGTWMRFRNALCEQGFSFEYSATFGQAVKNSPVLSEQYAKNILFDYSYRYFYADGFGKDYQILNLDGKTQANFMDVYLTACLLSFFQQQYLYSQHEALFRPFNIEKPLWIFVGGSVTASLGKKEASDIVEILLFLSHYLQHRNDSIKHIERILQQGVLDAQGNNLFAKSFDPLTLSGLNPAQIYSETLKLLFNAPGGGLLHVENLKGANGEVALRVGENEPFGVINVGDDAKLVKLCETHKLQTGEREFSGSLFHKINTPHSSVNLLIGSKKFTEGWSSWRVSTMGLMNVGKGEGAQIIQLFGRGVRLKGYGMSLKRTTDAARQGNNRPKFIHQLETLGIFGIHANYMAQFRDFLEEEGLPKDGRGEIFLPVIRNANIQKLKTLGIQKSINGISTETGDAFRQLGPIPVLATPNPITGNPTVYLQDNPVVVNWYPKIQTMNLQDQAENDRERPLNKALLNSKHLAFLDIDALYFELQRFKAERGWHNLHIPHSAIAELLQDTSWYELYLPAEELAFDAYRKVRLWQEIALSLLKKYTERYYHFRKQAWELPHLEYQRLDENNANLKDVQEGGYYRIVVDKSQQAIIHKLQELKSLIAKGEMKPWAFGGIKAILSENHLYQPLLYLEGNSVEISPVALNKGEHEFVEDLQRFHEKSTDFFANKELYLLRNRSKGHGIGFFEAGNFFPDFILWLIVGEVQHIVFIDPKGIRNLALSDPKVQFHKTIKDIEKRLNEPDIFLDSYIVSNTPFNIMQKQWGHQYEMKDFREWHIVFQEDAHYIDDILMQLACCRS
ncbi:MAG: DEAD/DEAH box helicase family protein [Proteobacteria bacterium]|nr:DEAD/DEAH box helicase family protein [Pseudomonadota bacterium]